jgi:hypothetical protein
MSPTSCHCSTSQRIGLFPGGRNYSTGNRQRQGDYTSVSGYGLCATGLGSTNNANHNCQF